MADLFSDALHEPDQSVVGYRYSPQVRSVSRGLPILSTRVISQSWVIDTLRECDQSVVGYRYSTQGRSVNCGLPMLPTREISQSWVTDTLHKRDQSGVCYRYSPQAGSVSHGLQMMSDLQFRAHIGNKSCNFVLKTPFISYKISTKYATKQESNISLAAHHRMQALFSLTCDRCFLKSQSTYWLNKTLVKTDSTITNGRSRDTDYIGHQKQNEDKQKQKQNKDKITNKKKEKREIKTAEQHGPTTNRGKYRYVLKVVKRLFCLIVIYGAVRLVDWRKYLL